MTARRAAPNLYTIPAGAPFLETLAEAMLTGQLGLAVDLADPAVLARTTVYLPTRRAARAFAATLLAKAGRRALLLPRIVPLGDPDEAETLDLIGPSPDDVAVTGPQPIDALARRCLLALQLQQAAASGAGFNAMSPGAAFTLAADLAAILDGLQAEDIPAARLTMLDARRFDVYWQNTALFLDILGKTWEAVLADRGEVDPVAWRNGVIRRQAARLEARPPDAPVIVAGSTGSQPATAELIRAVGRSAAGAVVLPDLDLALDAAVWRQLMGGDADTGQRDRTASHPQAQLARLVNRAGAARDGVVSLGADDGALAVRRRHTHAALMPAELTDSWRALAERHDSQSLIEAFSTVRIVEADDHRHEAEVCAVAIREALAETDGSIALVTPDRALAERTAIELQRWGIGVDDSAGLPLIRTEAGGLLALLADLLDGGLSGDGVVALLRHRRVRLGFAPDALDQARPALEIGALRGTRSPADGAALMELAGSAAARAADRRAAPPLARLDASRLALGLALADALRQALAPLDQLAESTALADGAAALRAALTGLSRETDDHPCAFDGPDGAALTALLDDLAAAKAELPVGPQDLAAVVRSLMAERVVRVAGPAHPRVAILGLLEARLLHHDRVILGGLNEGVWPPESTTDPFLNRAMRAELGLSSPERRIGQSAHDFTQSFCAPAVILTRAVKSGGTPTLPSRFWQRLEALTPKAVWDASRAAGRRLANLAARLDAPAEVKPRRKPQPRPAATMQPRRFSVSEVETLFRDPYALYARRILDLAPLPEAGLMLDGSDRGLLLHAVMERFGRVWPQDLPADAEAELAAIGVEVFAPLRGEPDVESFWWPRFRALIPAIADWERARRADAARVAVELRARADVRLPDGAEVALTARADRIEVLGDGRLAILDFKTGSVPTRLQQMVGLAPQLPLEAALAARAAYVPVDSMSGGEGGSAGPGAVVEASYIPLKPGPTALQAEPFRTDRDIAAEAEDHLDGFLGLVAAFRAGRPFVPRFAPQFMRYAGDYDRLARVKEWSVLGDDDEGSEA